MKHEFKIPFELIPDTIYIKLWMQLLRKSNTDILHYTIIRTGLLNSLIPLPVVPTLLLTIIKIERQTSAAFGG